MADLLLREVPSEPTMSPDGRVVAFVVSRADTALNRRVGDIWSVGVGVGGTDAPSARVRWTDTTDLESDPEFAPVGRTLAFRSRANRGKTIDGRELDPKAGASTQIWLQRSADEPARRLTSASEGVDSFRWMSDGSGIVFKTRQSRAKGLTSDGHVESRGLGRAAGRDQRPWEFRRQRIDSPVSVIIATLDAGVSDWDLSPVDGRIVYASNGADLLDEESPTDIWIFDPADGSNRRLTTRWGPDTQPVFSGDGRWVGWKCDQDTTVTYSQEEVWVGLVDGNEQRCLSTDPDLAVDGPFWASGVLCGAVARGMDNGLIAFPVETPYTRMPGGELRVGPQPPPLEHQLRAVDGQFDSEFSASDRGSSVVYIHESMAEWPEVWWARNHTGPHGSKIRVEGQPDRGRLTKLAGNETGLEAARLVIGRSASSEALSIESLLALPDSSVFGPGPWPTITQLHGGPYNRNTARPRDNLTALVLASHGYLVYMPNFRGSRGYGNAFGTAARGRDFAEGPYRDVMAGLDSLIARGLADSTRLGIMGGSYGGYLSMFAITRTDRFKAAVSMYGMSSLITDFGNGRSPSYELEYLGEPYWKGNPLWTELSPAWHVDKIHTPLLLMHGENDPAVGISNSREMWTALTVLKRPVEFITYPREGHGFREPNHRIDACRRTVAWFDRYLK
jgi:dipeptidyl aminopeptidase/acylaminoacyl peptidase